MSLITSRHLKVFLWAVFVITTIVTLVSFPDSSAQEILIFLGFYIVIWLIVLYAYRFYLPFFELSDEMVKRAQERGEQENTEI